MNLVLTPLENAVSRLAEWLDQYDSEITEQNPNIRDQMMAGVIQAFAFTYGLSVKMIKRYLEQVSIDPAAVGQLSFRDLIRQASAQGLLRSDLVAWMRYRTNRGSTSHTYDQAEAEAIFLAIPEFLDEARYLLARLQEKNERLGWPGGHPARSSRNCAGHPARPSARRFQNLGIR